MNWIRYSIITVTITLVPWLIYLTPWQLMLTALGPWAPWVTVAATALSPLIAVQVTRILDRGSERRRERVHLFQTLMAYRKAQFESLDFCRAISLIDVIFNGTSKGERKILDSLNSYGSEVSKNLSTLSKEQISAMSEPEMLTWIQKNNEQTMARSDALNDLLHSIAEHLDMNISHQVIATNGFWPAWVSVQISAHREGAQANVDIANMIRSQVTVKHEDD